LPMVSRTWDVEVHEHERFPYQFNASFASPTAFNKVVVFLTGYRFHNKSAGAVVGSQWLDNLTAYFLSISYHLTFILFIVPSLEPGIRLSLFN
jgi:hypothetical protein